MSRFAVCVYFIVTAVVYLNQNVHASVGGHCEFLEYELLGKIESTDDDQVHMITESLENQQIHVSSSDFRSPISKNQFYWISVREHTSGGCSPFDIRSVTQVENSNINLLPDSGRLYQSAFAMAQLRACARDAENQTCLNSENNFHKLSEEEKELLKNIKPKSIKHCSFTSIKKILKRDEPLESNTAFVACLSNDIGEENILQLTTRKKEGNPVVLIKIN